MSEGDITQRSATRTFRIANPPHGAVYWQVISFCERILAGLLFVTLLPVLIPVALAIVALSKRSPLIAHKRVGQGGGEVWVIKLRTMWDRGRGPTPPWELIEWLLDAPSNRPMLKSSRDPRVPNSFVAFLRQHSIDELPQLWQVACGELALIGPRPITRNEIDEYYGADAEVLLSHKPGITGLWQVCGRNRLNYPQRRRLDLFMIRKWSLPLYLLILTRTIYRVPLGKDAW